MDPIGQSIAGTLPSRLQAHTYLKSLNVVIFSSWTLNSEAAASWASLPKLCSLESRGQVNPGPGSQSNLPDECLIIRKPLPNTPSNFNEFGTAGLGNLF